VISSGPREMNLITIHPFGEIDSALLDAVKGAVADRFGMPVSIRTSLVVPTRAYSARRGQYRSTTLLEELARVQAIEGQIKLGITLVDLFVPDLNFVFGEASRADRAAVFSLARLDTDRPGDAARQLLVNRAVTEAVHELGHVFGLGHCRQSKCVMCFSNTLSETDRKGSRFCPSCAPLLEHQLAV